MAKKKKPNAGIMDQPFPIDPMSLDDDQMKSMLAFGLFNLGVTPDEYKQAYERLLSMASEMDEMFSDDGDDDDEDEPIAGPHIMRPFGRKFDTRKPLENAGELSLRLKIQMKDVTKPPMWREVVVPADYNFSQLHYAIQAVTGLMNCHLWQFQEHAYNSPYDIGIPRRDEFGFGVEDITHDADETYLTSFLREKNDKIEYVYDFGDDWIFVVKVLEVRARGIEGDAPQLLKWSSDMQPVENSGGIWSYTEMRELMANRDKLTAKQRKQIAKNHYFDSFEDMVTYFVDDHTIDPEFIAERLSEIPDKWEDPDDD